MPSVIPLYDRLISGSIYNYGAISLYVGDIYDATFCIGGIVNDLQIDLSYDTTENDTPDHIKPLWHIRDDLKFIPHDERGDDDISFLHEWQL